MTLDIVLFNPHITMKRCGGWVVFLKGLVKQDKEGYIHTEEPRIWRRQQAIQHEMQKEGERFSLIVFGACIMYAGAVGQKDPEDNTMEKHAWTGARQFMCSPRFTQMTTCAAVLLARPLAKGQPSAGRTNIAK